MPLDYRNLHVFAEFLQTAELIVDEGLERTDIENREARGLPVRYRGQDRQKRRLGLSGSGRRGDQDVAVAVQHLHDGAGLDLSQFVPALVADPTLNLWVKPVVRCFKSRCGGW